MVDLSITASQVQPGAGVVYGHGVAAEAITAGQALYMLAAGTIGLADNDSSAKVACIGIAVCNAAAGQIVEYQRKGTITIGAAASITAGIVFFVSSTAGGIMPETDLATGDTVSYIGVGDASNGIVMNLHNSGVEHA